MYSRLALTAGRLKPLELQCRPLKLQCRNLSLVTLNKFGLSSHNQTINRHNLKLNPTEHILKNCVTQQRNFSVSTFRLDAATTTASAVVTEPQTKELLLDFLPDKPIPVDPTTLIGEPSFEMLGLGSWWPAGRVQLLMEWIHVDIGLEWYQTITLVALTMRMCTFPFVVMAQKNAANMHNVSPGMAVLQEKMSDARRRGDQMESAELGHQLSVYMTKNGINPIKNILPILVQLPIFMSMFIGLRGMAKLPVPSMEEGGILWFENLCMYDPFYILPVIMASSMYLQFRMGAEGAKLDSMGPTGRILMSTVPFILVPFTMNFPSALTYYWCCTNLISIAQASILRVPPVRAVLGIPAMKRHEQTEAAKAKKKAGFRESFRETIDNFKVQADIADRRALDEQAFRDAGVAKPVKTYSYDPSKPVSVRPKSKY